MRSHTPLLFLLLTHLISIAADYAGVVLVGPHHTGTDYLRLLLSMFAPGLRHYGWWWPSAFGSSTGKPASYDGLRCLALTLRKLDAEAPQDSWLWQHEQLGCGGCRDDSGTIASDLNECLAAAPKSAQAVASWIAGEAAAGYACYKNLSLHQPNADAGVVLATEHLSTNVLTPTRGIVGGSLFRLLSATGLFDRLEAVAVLRLPHVKHLEDGWRYHHSNSARPFESWLCTSLVNSSIHSEAVEAWVDPLAVAESFSDVGFDVVVINTVGAELDGRDLTEVLFCEVLQITPCHTPTRGWDLSYRVNPQPQRMPRHATEATALEELEVLLRRQDCWRWARMRLRGAKLLHGEAGAFHCECDAINAREFVPRDAFGAYGTRHCEGHLGLT